MSRGHHGEAGAFLGVQGREAGVKADGDLRHPALETTRRRRVCCAFLILHSPKLSIHVQTIFLHFMKTWRVQCLPLVRDNRRGGGGEGEGGGGASGFSLSIQSQR